MFYGYYNQSIIIRKCFKKILILFDTEDSFKNKLVNDGYVLFSIFERNGDENLKEEAKNYGCSYYLENMKVKSV